MSTNEQSVTLPADLLETIDRLGVDRARFVAEAVQRELARRDREGLLESLRNPHPDSQKIAEEGFAEWAASLPDDIDGLVDPNAGTSVRWVPGVGWRYGDEAAR